MSRGRASGRFFSTPWVLPLLPLLSLVAGLSACARAARISGAIHKSWFAAGSPPSKHKPAAATTHYAARTASLEITPGLQVAGVVPLPRDFDPDTTRAPVWLSGGSEIGLIGTRAATGVMLAIGGVGLSRQRVVLEESKNPTGARWFDVATSRDGHTLAIVVVAPTTYRLDVILSDASNPRDAHRIASLKGEFDWAQLSWLTNGNLALAVHANAPASEQLSNETATVTVSGLYLIKVGQHSSIRRLDGITCPLSALAFSPNNAVAVAQGENGTPPAIIDTRHENCVRFPSAAPLEILGWAPNSEAFIYQRADRAGVFRFDLQNGRTSTIAISSGAGAYTSDGTIIAFGSQELSWRRAAAEPTAAAKAQIALFHPDQNLTTINSLGFATQPALLAQSAMIVSPVSNNAIIDTAIPGPTGLEREIIEYSYPARAAFILAHGPARGPIALSWSPDGRRIAIVDGDDSRHTLSVITPPK